MVKWSAFSMFILWIVGKENMHLVFFVDFHTSMVFLLLLDLSFWLCNVLIGHTNYVHSPFLHIEAVKQWHLCITSYHSTSPISIIGRIIIKPYSVSLIVKRWNRSQCYVAAVHLYNFIDDLYDMVTCITFFSTKDQYLQALLLCVVIAFHTPPTKIFRIAVKSFTSIHFAAKLKKCTLVVCNVVSPSLCPFLSVRIWMFFMPPLFFDSISWLDLFCTRQPIGILQLIMKRNGGARERVCVCVCVWQRNDSARGKILSETDIQKMSFYTCN